MRPSQHRLFADYFQFYIQDEPAEGNLGEAWSREAVERMLAVIPGVVGIGTFRNWHVPVTLEVHDGEPKDDHSGWDQVVECDLNVASGRIVVAGCTDHLPDAVRIEVTPGNYLVRVSFGAPTKLSDDGLDADDRYRVQLWPRSPIASRVLVQRSPEQQSDPVVWNTAPGTPTTC